MPNNSMISIRPDYEIATRYGSAWQTYILNAADNVGLPYTDFYGDNANSANFFSGIESQDPILVNIFGHGNYNLIACQNGEYLLQGGVNTNMLAGRVVYDLSCRAGRDLGDIAVSEGCVSFLGYDEDFIFVIVGGSHPDGGMSNPLADEVSRGFFEAHNIAPISFIQGRTTADSYYDSQDVFDYWINVWNEIDSQVAGFLVWDKDHQVIKPSVGPAPGGLLPVMLMFAPLLLIPILKSKHLKKLKPL